MFATCTWACRQFCKVVHSAGILGLGVSGVAPTMLNMTNPAMVIDSEALDRIGLEVDMRLTDVWAMLFEQGDAQPDTEFLGWLLRLSYVTGYWDALSEQRRGELCEQLGYPIPERQGESASDQCAEHGVA